MGVRVRISHDHTKSEMRRLRNRLNHQWVFMCELTSISQGNWVRVKGIPEDAAEEKQSQIEERIYDLVKFVGMESIQLIDIERANRVGPVQKAKKSGIVSRVIVAEMSSKI